MARQGGVSTVTYEDPTQYLSSSISSLSSQRAQSSWIAKTYRHAAQLYLTRRLAEALEAITPLVSPDPNIQKDQTNGDQAQDASSLAAPVAASSRGTRVKVWSFYLTLLNAIIELGAEEGKLAFGSTRWKAIAAKARDGTIWEEVVRHGYGGTEGEVDGEVVANLATLLLTHMASQKLNQQRLETYLSASAHPSLDIAAHMAGRPNPHRTNSSSGTDTPRDLNTRLKLLELYTLHVLPRNEEWDYAREFISMSEMLDEERREAFLFALHSLQEEKSHDAIRETELKKRQEEELERRQQEERDEQSRLDDSRRLEEDRRRQEMEQRRHHKAPSSNGSTKGSGESSKPRKSARNSRDQPAAKSDKARRKPAPPPPTLYHRASLLVSTIQSSFLQAQRSMMQNPTSMLRFLLFLFAFAMAFARRDVRERLRRMLNSIWDRIRRTIGMGVKVSYI